MNIARVAISNRSVATLPAANRPAGLGEPGPKTALKMPPQLPKVLPNVHKFTGGSQPVDPLHHVPDDGVKSVREAAIAKAEASASPELIERAREAAIKQAEASVSLTTPLNLLLQQAVRF